MSECIEWQGPRNESGYGICFMAMGKRMRAHRMAYELIVGPIPEGLTIDHLCKNKICINPDHLEAVTLVENVMRSDSPPAINARKTHCERGHELSGGNLSEFSRRGSRHCKTCNRLRMRRTRSEAVTP